MLLIPIGFGGLLANIPIANIAKQDHDGMLGIIYDMWYYKPILSIINFYGCWSDDRLWSTIA